MKKESKSMEEKVIVMKSIWKLFDVLRGDLNTEDYSIILLFIYLRSENIISEKTILSSEIKSTILHLDHFEEDKGKVFHEVINIFYPFIEMLSESTIRQLVGILSSIDYNWLKENNEKVFDETLERIASSQGRLGGEFIQPKELTQFIELYIGKTHGLNIYNPFAGVASFIKGFKESNHIYAQELNRKTWAIGQLRLFTHKSTSEFKCEDSILNWNYNRNYDLIISHPPFGSRINREYRNQFPQIRTSEEFLISMGIDTLSDDGKLITVLSNGFLFRGGSEAILREKLIRLDLIDSIISFPGGTLKHTGIPFIMLVLNKSKSNPGKIRLIDASSFVKKQSTRENTIEANKLINSIQMYENSEIIRIIDNKEVIDNNLNLNIPRYFKKDIEGKKLGEILNFIRGERRNIPNRGKLIRVRNLKDEKTNFQLDIEQVEDVPLTRTNIHKVNTSCLLLTNRWKSLKPTYFQFEKHSIFRTSDILSFKVDDQKVDIGYLVNELQAEYVQKQLDCFRQGTSIPFIRKEDLMEVKIKLPSIEEQRAKVLGINEISEKIHQLQTERNALAHGIRSKKFNEFASLKHTLGRPRQNILGWSKNLSKFFTFEKEMSIELNDEFKEMFDLGLIEAINEINRDIKFISDVLEKGENGLILNDYKKTILSLNDLNRTIDKLSMNGLKFSIKKHLLKIDEMKDRGILINITLLKTLLDNLFTNANKYGFKEQKEGNFVKIEISEIDDHIIIDVRNNGLPFPNNFDREKFITKYSTADSSNGSGLGGYDINRIATYFDNNDWELILNDDPIYSVIFRFSLPIKQIN
jgi:type I restriction enzyme M protein